MQPNSLVHVIDDDEAVRESLAFLLNTARLAGSHLRSATAFLSSLPSANPDASSRTCGCRESAASICCTG